MKTTEYLYGIQSKTLVGMNYVNALSYKINSARELMNSLRLEAGLVLHDETVYTPILNRYLACEKAIKHNQVLLAELDE